MKKILFAFLLIVVVFLTACDPTTINTGDKDNPDDDIVDDGDNNPGDDDDGNEDDFIPLEGIDASLILSFEEAYNALYDGEKLVYYFYLPEDIMVTVEVQAEFDSVVVVKNLTTDETVFEGEDSIYGEDIYTVLALEAGEYMVELSGYEEDSGTFSLNLSEGSSLENLVIDQVKTSTMTESDVNAYLLEITQAGIYHIYSDSSLDLEGVLVASNGNYITYNDDRRFNDEDFELMLFLEVGYYMVGVRAYDGEDTGSYDLLVEEFAHENETVLDEGDFLSGFLLAGETNRLELVVPSAGWVTLYSDTVFDSVGYLYDSLDTLINESDDDGDNGDFWMEVYLEAGSYSLDIGSYDDYEGGYYEVFYQFSESVDQNDYQEIVVGGSVDGSLDFSEIGFFELDLSQAMTIDVYTTGIYDTTLRMVDAFGVEVGFDDDSGEDLNARIENLSLEAGLYTIQVTEFSGSPVDGYTLHVEEEDGVSNQTDGVISLGGYIVGSLVADQTAIYELEIVSGQYVDIYTNSEFDMTLSVYNASGELIAYNDDMGSDTDSYIDDLYLNPGLYYLHVEEFFADPVTSFELHAYGDTLDTPSDSVSVLINSTTNDALVADEVAIFELIIGEGKYVDIYTSGFYDMYTEIYDAYGTLIAYSDDSAEDTNSSFVDLYLSPGVYYIYVEEFFGDPVTDYALNIYESDWMVPTIFTEIIINNYVVDALAPNETHAFQFIVEEDLSVDVFTKGNSDMILWIYDEAGNQIAYDDNSGDENNSKINNLELGPGTYYIYVEEYSYLAVAYYELYVHSNYGPPTSYTSIGLDTSILDSLQAGYSNSYELILNQATLIDLSTISSGVMMLWIYDDNQDFVYYQADTEEDGSLDIQGLYLESGVYYIYLADLYGQAIEDFTLSVQTSESGSTDDVQSILVDQTIVSSIEAGIYDVFELIVVEGGYVDIELSSSYDLFLELYNANNEFLIYDDDSGSDLNPLISSQYLDPGVYYIYVSEYDFLTVDSYTITVSSSGLFTSLTLGDNVTDSLSAGEYGFFALTVTSGGYVDVFTVSEADMYVEIYDYNMQLVAYDDDSGFDNDSAILGCYLVPGTYYIYTSEYNLEVVDSYELYTRVGEAPIDAGVTYIEVGQYKTATLDEGVVDVYQLNIDYGQYVDIYTAGVEDMYVEIYDRFGNLVAYDDDSGQGANSGFYQLYLEANVYYIYVNEYNYFSASYYELHVE